MKDEAIVALYWERREGAIRETDIKYGSYCHTIAYNVLHSHEDAGECVNDTWEAAWEAMPPQRPQSLRGFLGRLTRNIAIDRYRYYRSDKRNAEVACAMDEYWACIPNGEASLEDEWALKQAINGFLATLDTRSRVIFLRRYWYSMRVKDIAEGMQLSESHVSVILHRTRDKFKEYLTKEGIFV